MSGKLKAYHLGAKMLTALDIKGANKNPEQAHKYMEAKMYQEVSEALQSGRTSIDSLLMNTYKSLSYKNDILNITRTPEGKDPLFFDNPLIYSAGSDKYGKGQLYNEKIFGGIYIGGITKTPRLGNFRESYMKPLARVSKDPKTLSMTNSFGLNNDGVDQLVTNMKLLQDNGLFTQKPVGYNIAGNTEDFAHIAERLGPIMKDHQAFIELNFSCPNHSGTENIQQEYDTIRNTIRKVKQANIHNKPIVIKYGIISGAVNPDLAKDLSEEQIRELTRIAIEEGADGVNFCNTAKEHFNNTKMFDQKRELKNRQGSIVGGMSGNLIQERVEKTLRIAREELDKNDSKILLIGTGGIGANKKWEEIGHHAVSLADHGVDLFGMFTGFIYSPASAARALQAIAKRKKYQENGLAIPIDDTKKFVKHL